MQDEVESKTLTLIVSGTKFTGRLFKAAIMKYLAHLKEQKMQKQREKGAEVKPQGKQTVKQLIGQNQGVSNLEITDPSIKAFERVARKYGVDYAVKKDRSCSPPKYLVFFKARDADALTSAFTEYTHTQLFNLLCEKADDVYGGRLPVHVRCLIDECANIGQIPKLEKLVATIRSREISACLVLQAQSQLKAIYKDNARQLYLSATEIKYVAAQHVVDLNFQVIPHASGVLILINERVQGVVVFRSAAERIATRPHIFFDALCYVSAIFQHFNAGKSISKIKVYVHGQTGQVKNRQVDRRSTFEGK